MSEPQKRIPIVVTIPRPEDRFTYAWIGWALLSGGGFAALQSYALRRGQHNRTLSVHTRKLLGIYPRKPWHPIGRAFIIGGMAGFAAWFSHHIAFAPGDDPRLRGLILEEIAE